VDEEASQKPNTDIFLAIQPVIFLVLFTQLFAKFGALLGPGVNYTVFATAGIVLQNAFSSAFQSGTAIVDDIRFWIHKSSQTCTLESRTYGFGTDVRRRIFGVIPDRMSSTIAVPD